MEPLVGPSFQIPREAPCSTWSCIAPCNIYVGGFKEEGGKNKISAQGATEHRSRTAGGSVTLKIARR